MANTQACCRRLQLVLTRGNVCGYHYFVHYLRACYTRRHSVTIPHCHLGYEVFAVLDGGMDFTSMDGVKVSLDTGMILVIPAKLRHATYRTEASCFSITLRFFMDPPLLPPLPLQVLHDPRAFQEVLALLAEAADTRIGWQERAQLRLSVLLSLILTTGISSELAAVSPTEPLSLSQRVDTYLRKHLVKTITLADVADAIDISIRSLIRQFKAETGETVMNRLLTLRIDQAVSLLIDRSDLSIKQVSSIVGLPHPAHFSNCFRRVMGMSPKQYRTHSLVSQTHE